MGITDNHVMSNRQWRGSWVCRRRKALHLLKANSYLCLNVFTACLSKRSPLSRLLVEDGAELMVFDTGGDSRRQGE
jgi:hypothetical protein